MSDKNELVVIVEEQGLEITQSEHILNNFTEFFKRAKEWELEARSLTVSDVSEVDKMTKAREVRLSLRDIRLEAEKTRKSLKEKALREGKAIDGVANVIKALIEPLEEHLEAQEKFAENIKKQEEERKQRERTELVSSLGGDPYMYNIKDMSDEIFGKLVENLKKQKEDKEKEEKEAEERRIENEKKHVLWEKRRFEMAPYKDFFSPDTAITVDTDENTFRAIMVKLVKNKLDYDNEQKEIKKENERLNKEKEEKAKQDEEERKKRDGEQKKKDEEHEIELEKERIEKKRLADELKKKDDEEFERKMKEEKEKQAKEEEDRQKKLAPEKEKLFAWSEQIKSIEVPDGLSKAGLQIVKEAEEALLKISQDIKLKIKNL